MPQKEVDGGDEKLHREGSEGKRQKKYEFGDLMLEERMV